MRKYSIIALATALVVAFAGFAIARDDIQTIKVKVTPSELDKKKFSNAKLFVDIDTVPDDEQTPNDEQPPSANRTRVDFSKNLKFNTDARPHCKVTSEQIQNQSRENAIKLCGRKSVVSLDNGTDAQIQFDPFKEQPQTEQPSPPITLPVAVTAFNGKEKNTIYLHTDPGEAIETKAVLVGKLKKGPAGFGKTLDVSIPATPPFSIKEFRTTVKAGGYVKARCKDKVATYQARTNYSNHTPTKATATVKCKRK